MKMYIDADYYVQVDETKDFRVTSEYAVGSAGCVLRLDAIAKPSRALKIPLLRATNLGENLQVCKLLMTEWLSVSKLAGGRNLVPMVGARGVETICAPLLIIPEKTETRQSEGVLLVGFASDGRPRVVNSAVFAQYSPKNNEVAAFKELLDGDIRSLAAREPKRIYYLLKKRYVPAEGEAPELEKGVFEEKTSRPMFFNVPSITYEWKPRNLQADISTGLLDNASYGARLGVVGLMLDAVDSLHSENVLHCDIRPANIFRSDEEVPEVGYDQNQANGICRGYELGDFGSLNDRSNRESDPGQVFGDSVLGPAVAALRTSLFYAPERRITGEFEDADHVAITPTQNGLCRVDLKYAKYERIPDAHGRAAEKLPDIRPGDSLRVRDLVLTIKSTTTERAANVTASFICDSTVARIVHSRLSLLETLREPEDFAVSGYVVIRQWSRATDMFSIGVLLLYLLFVKQARVASTSDSKPLETMFAECLETICAKPYFESFWPRLALFTGVVLQARKEQEQASQEKASQEQPYRASDYLADREVTDVDKQAVKITEYAKTVTNDLTASCPFIDIIFHALDSNSARFVLNIWFAMACIHRAEDLPKGSWDGPYQQPFCRSRVDMENSDGGKTQAERAFDVLKEIEGLISPSSPDLKSFRLSKVNPFSLQSDYVVRLQLNAILDELGKLKGAVTALDKGFMPTIGESARRVVQLARELADEWSIPADTKDVEEGSATTPAVGESSANA
jgi:serine/threonine protein kinase